MILSLVNVKGGVGKTTTAVNLAAAFARSGLSALLVDLDPQGSASFSLGVNESEPSPSVADVLLRSGDLSEAVWDTHVENLSLLPGSMELAAADVALARRKEPQLALARGLSKGARESWSTGAQAYSQLGGEVIRRSRQRGWL